MMDRRMAKAEYGDEGVWMMPWAGVLSGSMGTTLLYTLSTTLCDVDYPIAAGRQTCRPYQNR